MAEYYSYHDLADTKSEWNSRPVEEQVVFYPREERVDVRYRNPDFSELVPELVALHEKGELGNFSLLPPYEQYISADLKFSRKVGVWHPKFPEYNFWITGIGVVTRLEDGRLKIDPPSPEETVFSRGELPPRKMYTWRIEPDGTEKIIKCSQPLGAYKPEQSQKKLDNTLNAQELFGETARVIIPVLEGIGKNANGSEYGIFDYALPSDALSLRYISLVDKTYTWDNLILQTVGLPIQDQWDLIANTSYYSASMEQSFYALGMLNLHGRVFRQYHLGNLFYRPTVHDRRDALIVSDCETILDVSQYPQDQFLDNNGLSPFYKSLWKDVAQSLWQNTRISHPLNPWLSVPHIIKGISGYMRGRGFPAPDEADLYQSFLGIYEDKVGEEWIDGWDVYNNPFVTYEFKRWFRQQHDETSKRFIENWANEYGLFKH